MKITEDDIEYFGHFDIKGRPKMERIKKQILENQEKAEKWQKLQDKLFENGLRLTDRWLHLEVEYWLKLDKENTKMRESKT